MSKRASFVALIFACLMLPAQAAHQTIQLADGDALIVDDQGKITIHTAIVLTQVNENHEQLVATNGQHVKAKNLAVVRVPGKGTYVVTSDIFVSRKNAAGEDHSGTLASVLLGTN
jgi:hypothetical protein